MHISVIFTSMYFVSGTLEISMFHCHHGGNFFWCFATSALANIIQRTFKMLQMFIQEAVMHSRSPLWLEQQTAGNLQ